MIGSPAPARWWHTALAIVCAGWWLRKIAAAFPSNQWDFKVYYYAAQAWRAGLNPYDSANLPPVAGTDVYPFVYPPYTLGFFALFTRLPLEHALLAFLVMKLVLLATLVWFWSRLLRTSVVAPEWVLFLLFGYASCIYVDFASGNVTILEQSLLWLGLSAFLARRYWTFVAAIVAASSFKLTPVALLVLCVAIPDRRGAKYAAVGMALFGALLLVTYLASHQLAVDFIRSAANLDEPGRVNPSALALVKDTALLAARASGYNSPVVVQLAAYGSFVLLIVIATSIGAKHLLESQALDRAEVFVYLTLLAFAIVQPRFKNYSYILVLVPTFFVATRSARLRRAVPLLLLACIPVYSWITSVDNLTLVANYASWFIALCAWALCLYELRADGHTHQIA